jgi:hypothetical protein
MNGESQPFVRRERVALALAAALLLWWVWAGRSPAPSLVYELTWVHGPVLATDTGWELTRADGSLVRVTTFELVTHAAELMPCQPQAATETTTRLSDWLIPSANAGHSGMRNDIATPFPVVELPLRSPTMRLEPAALSAGPWCRVHWLAARRDATTVAEEEATLPMRQTLLLQGEVLHDGRALPFRILTPLGNGRYLDLPEPLRLNQPTVVVVERDAQVLLNAIDPTLPPAQLERHLLRALVDGTRVRMPGAAP